MIIRALTFLGSRLTSDHNINSVKNGCTPEQTFDFVEFYIGLFAYPKDLVDGSVMFSVHIIKPHNEDIICNAKHVWQSLVQLIYVFGAYLQLVL